MKNIYYFYIILVIIIIILLLILVCRKPDEPNKISGPLKYYRCDNKELGQITKNVFDTYNIEKDNSNWNVYVPCGYNQVESELLDIKIMNKMKNKFIFGINGCDSIVSKNNIWDSLVKCYGRKEAKNLMPETYILNNRRDMELFKKEYDPNNIYILKKNVQRKEGLKLTKDYSEIIEGKKDNYKVVQNYVRDLYLVNGRKVNLRIYLLIMIKDGNVQFYVSKLGKCIYTKKTYNDNDLDFESNITSYHLDLSVYKENPRDFDDLRKYIGSDILFKRIDTILQKICYCLSKNLYQSENIMKMTSFQLFGIDVIFTKNLHPYLLEMNKGPDMAPKDKHDEKMKYKVQDDMFKRVGIIEDTPDNSFYLIYDRKKYI